MTELLGVKAAIVVRKLYHCVTRSLARLIWYFYTV